MEKKKVILDVDTGIDDALSIAYAVKSGQLDLLGLTTCFGNVQVNDATRNTQFILKLLGVKIPVYEGLDRPLNQKEPYLKVADRVHGLDGLGNCLPDYELKKTNIEEWDAVRFIIDSVKKFPNELTLIFVGPLTNLAKVIEEAPDVIDLVKEVVIMGGAITVPGNVRPYAEANIYSDPNAANMVLKSGLPIKLVGLDVTMQTLLSKDYVNEWAKSESDVSKFFAKVTDYYIGAYEEVRPEIGGCGLHDPLAVGAVLDPTFVGTEKMRVEVETTGDTIGKTSEAKYGENAIDVCLTVDVERFLHHFLTTLSFDK